MLIALKAPEDAHRIYQMGLKKANRKSPFYTEIQKRFEVLDASMPKEAEPDVKGQLSSLPIDVFGKVFGLLTEETRVILSRTQKRIRNMCLKCAFELPNISLDKYKQGQFLKLFATNSLLKTHKWLSVHSQTLEFLSAGIKHVKQSLAKRLLVSKLQLHIGQDSVEPLFQKALQSGLKASLKHLRLSFDSNLCTDSAVRILKSVFASCELRSLAIADPGGILRGVDCVLSGSTCTSLQVLQLDANANSKMFSRCHNLLVLIAPGEARMSQFDSERLRVLHCRVSTATDGIVPRPVSHLKLSNATEQLRFIDISQYSYLALETLNLENVTFGVEKPLLNSNWCQLRVLRLHQVHFYQPQSDLTALLLQTRNLRVLEISAISTAHFSEFDVTTVGLWLINLVFSAESLCNLEHFILKKIQLGPSALSALIKGFRERKLKRIKVFGLVDAQTHGAPLAPLFKLFRHAYPDAYLLTSAEQGNVYNQEFNLFTEALNFVL